MKAEKAITQKITKDIFVSLFLYALPVLLMFLALYVSAEKPWQHYIPADAKINGDNFFAQIFNHLASWGLPLIMVIVGVIEFAYGLYENHWSKNERMLDIVCFILPKILVGPFITYTLLKLLPAIIPND